MPPVAPPHSGSSNQRDPRRPHAPVTHPPSHPLHPLGPHGPQHTPPSTHPATPTTPAHPAAHATNTYRAPYANDAFAQDYNRTFQLATEAMGQPYQDTFNNMTPMEAALLGFPDTANGGGGGGGGGGGPSTPSAATIAAYQQMLAALGLQNAASDQSYSDRSKSLTDLQSQGDTRLQTLMSQLAASRDAARTSVAGSYGGTDQALQSLAAQYARGASGRDAGANRSLQAFGAAPTVTGSGNAAQDMLTAARAQNTQLGGAADASFVNRSNVYNGLMGDTQSQYNNMYTQLQAQIAAQRQAAAIAQAQQRAQLAIDAAKNGVQL